MPDEALTEIVNMLEVEAGDLELTLLQLADKIREEAMARSAY